MENKRILGRFSAGWMAKKLVRTVLVFFFASAAVFLAVEAMPEDPVSLRVKNPDPQRIEEIRDTLGLNDPAPVRYLHMVGNFLQLKWGDSLISGRSVLDDIRSYLPATLELGVFATIWGVFLGCSLVLMGHASGYRKLLVIVKATGALGLTVPIFWIGLILIILFSVWLNWLPVGGRYDFSFATNEQTGFLLVDSLREKDGAAFMRSLKHLILPVLTLSLYPMALVAGTLESRLNLPQVSQIVKSLKSRGFGPVRIWGKHILRLMSGPVVTVIGTQTGALMGGAVLTETVFSWPGMGRYLVDGVINRDVFVIQNGLLLVIIIALLVVTISDLFAGILNRQLKEEREGDV